MDEERQLLECRQLLAKCRQLQDGKISLSPEELAGLDLRIGVQLKLMAESLKCSSCSGCGIEYNNPKRRGLCLLCQNSPKCCVCGKVGKYSASMGYVCGDQQCSWRADEMHTADMKANPHKWGLPRGWDER